MLDKNVSLPSIGLSDKQIEDIQKYHEMKTGK